MPGYEEETRPKATAGFELHGQEKTDSVLFPWVFGSIGRALFFYAEAMFSRDNRAIAAISAYYSLFHLSMFMLFSCPHLLKEDDRKKINQKLNQGITDPSKAISHQMIDDFLTTCINNGLPRSVRDAVTESRQFREFINYGPRIQWPKEKDAVFVNTCELEARGVDHALSNIKRVFEEVVNWTCENSVDRGVWTPIALESAKPFFSEPEKFYAGWCPTSVIEEAETLRLSLYLAAKEQVFPNGHLRVKTTSISS